MGGREPSKKVGNSFDVVQQKLRFSKTQLRFFFDAVKSTRNPKNSERKQSRNPSKILGGYFEGTWEGTIIPRGGRSELEKVRGVKIRERVRRRWHSALYPAMLLVATVDSCVHKTRSLDAIVPTRLDP